MTAWDVGPNHSDVTMLIKCSTFFQTLTALNCLLLDLIRVIQIRSFPEVTIAILAEDHSSIPLRVFLDQMRCTATGALFGNRFIPHHIVAVGVTISTVEDLPSTRFPLHEFALTTFRAADTGQIGFDIPTLGIISTGDKLSEPAVLLYKIGPTLRAFFVQRLLLVDFHLSFRVTDDLLGILAFGIA